ncbi:MAG: DUF695 domain-containing protein [Clostridiales bacterium]|nr:DUF695 domain-containing protein [Clostridiales bacterium]
MTDFLTYEWEWMGKPAAFRVDMQYWELLPVLDYHHLLYACCAPRDQTAGAFTHAEAHRATQLPAQIAGQFAGRIIYVGSVTLDAMAQHYYYTADAKLVNDFSALCRSEKKLRIGCGHGLEPKFVTYYRFLFPDDAKLQSVENAAFIKSLRLPPAACALVRRVNLNFSFLNEQTRSLFLSQVPDLGMVTSHIFASGSKTHPCCATVTGFCALLLPELNRYTARAIRVAAKMDGILERVTLGE